jgi:hypothetical protein
MSKKSCTSVPLPRRRSAGAERCEQFAAGIVAQHVEIDGTLALVAQQFVERRAAFFLGWLQLIPADLQQVHLQRFREEIL